MDKKIMNITEISELRNISVENLVEEYGFRAVNGDYSTRVNSSPNIIYCGKGQFIGSFIFDKDVIKRIVLMPIIPGIKAPNYPSEEYQNAKKEYCISILRDIYGNETTSNDEGAYWERDDSTIGCCLILEGKGQYTGGDIFIDIR